MAKKWGTSLLNVPKSISVTSVVKFERQYNRDLRIHIRNTTEYKSTEGQNQCHMSFVLTTFEFSLSFWSCWGKSRKNWGAAEKNKEKIEASCTGCSAEFFGSQSLEMLCFARKTKFQRLTTFCQSLTSLGLSFPKELQLYSLTSIFLI